jgi:methyl-accepting chemotaxis protein
MRVRGKLLIVGVMAAVLIALILWRAILFTEHSKEATKLASNQIEDIVNDEMVEMKASVDILSGTSTVAFMVMELGNISTAEEFEIIMEAVQPIVNDIYAAYDTLDVHIQDGRGYEVKNEMLALRAPLDQLLDNIVAKAMKNDIEGAHDLLRQNLLFLSTPYLAKCEELVAYCDSNARVNGMLGVESADAITEEARGHEVLIMILGVVAVLIVLLLNYVISRNITKRLNLCTDGADKLASGITNVDFRTGGSDEIAQLANSMEVMSNKINSLVSDIQVLASDATIGNLDTRMNSDLYQGEYKSIAQGLNNTLNAVIKPLNVTAEYVDRIAVGDLPPLITDDYKGDYVAIKNNINTLISSIRFIIEDMTKMSDAHIAGDLIKMDEEKYSGAYKTMVSKTNEMVFDGHVNIILKAIGIINEYAKGDFTNYMEDLPGAKIVLSDAIATVRTNLLTFRNELTALTSAAKDGYLDKRGDTKKLPGEWGELVGGVNDLLNAVITPLNMSAEYIDRISVGDMPPLITEEYKGDYLPIKNNMNTLITTLKDYIAEMNNMSEQHDLGDIDVIMDSSKFHGAYSRMAEGVNDMVNGHIAVKKKAMACVEQFGEGNFDAELEQFPGKKVFINEIIEKVRGQIKEFIHQMNYMSEQHDLGDIDVIMDSQLFNGSFKEMAEGVNNMVNGHIAVKKKAMACINEFGEGNFDAKIETFPGKKVFINEIIEKVRGNFMNFNRELGTLIQAAQSGRLNQRGAVNLFDGGWKEMVAGVNDMMEAVVAPIYEAGDVLAELAKGDLTSKMDGLYQGQFETLKEDINLLSHSLNEMVSQVNETVSTTASSAMDISSTAETLAAASQEMNSQADDVAAAVEEMARTVTENAQGATKTSAMAMENAHIAEEGGQVVQETVQKMGDIAKVVEETAINIQKLGESSQAIGEIVSVIDDIADQTNLLALNASIEAARAGEQGRGFAVVADEVRKLAEKTVDATKEIASQITGIQKETASAVEAMNLGTKEVESGMQLAQSAGEALEKVLTSSNDVTQMITDIAAASEQQAVTTEEISKNVIGISHATSESTHQVEAVAGTTEELTALTEQLSQLMAQFKVKREPGLLT